MKIRCLEGNNLTLFQSSQSISNLRIPQQTKKGLWKFIYKNKQIGSGFYNEKSQKICKWKQLSDDFWDQTQVIFNGQYQNSKKIGRWDIFYGEFELIGGGSYEEVGDCVQIGNYIELNNGFWSQSKVIFHGKYQNGKKVGKWKILYRKQRAFSVNVRYLIL